ncbi:MULTISPECIES: hypothetical protein [Acetobacteraceae]|nr:MULTISPECIES: hypothetical protein [Acetobacteraceae]AZV40687.1 hypothetical protein CXP35_17605 [Komagataeibacter xylinus]KDU95957.1 hypothetical protein GLUCORHAEAF1_05185 [Komagataeibacter rhaeticus AF1]MBV1825516.1 hypothetical protein [Komagataeibacter oboediens]PYD46488.1 hypothetical protein C3920_14815 [Novacetimonas pomaceti]
MIMREADRRQSRSLVQDDDLWERLRAIEDKLSLIIEIFSPEDSDGPTLDEILGRLVTLIAAQNPMLRRIDLTTGRLLDIQEGRTPRSARRDDEDGADA